jgi:hypothetical protein
MGLVLRDQPREGRARDPQLKPGFTVFLCRPPEKDIGTTSTLPIAGKPAQGEGPASKPRRVRGRPPLPGLPMLRNHETFIRVPQAHGLSDDGVQSGPWPCPVRIGAARDFTASTLPSHAALTIIVPSHCPGLPRRYTGFRLLVHTTSDELCCHMPLAAEAARCFQDNGVYTRKNQATRALENAVCRHQRACQTRCLCGLRRDDGEMQQHETVSAIFANKLNHKQVAGARGGVGIKE